VNLRGDNVSLPLPRGIRASADANLVAQGSQTSQLISGTIALRRAEYTENIDLADLINSRQSGSIAESGGNNGNSGGGSSILGATTRLDIRVEGRDALVIRNNLADAVASVSLQILGTLEDPLIAGRVASARGTLTFRGERYEITRAFIDLPAREDANLLVNLAAEADISGYRVFLSLSGELSETARPQVTVRSDPALPQADIVSLITTGQLATDGGLGGSLAGAGISTASGLIADTIINAPVQRATDRLFGLNIFEINPVTSTSRGVTLEPQLTVGRQVNRNLRVTYTTRLAAEPNQIVAVEYRISDRLSFLAQYEQGNTTSLGGRNNEFNFELRFRKRF
jgi:translocation and assembly module TamB